jgi:hypothetical protein
MSPLSCCCPEPPQRSPFGQLATLEVFEFARIIEEDNPDRQDRRPLSRDEP